MKTPSTQADRTGFTLLELLMVIAIIGLLASLGIPAIRSLTNTNKSGNAVRQLADDLTIARNKAIAERTTVYVVFVPTNFADVNLTPTGNPVRDVHYRRDVKTLEKLLDAKYTTYALFSWRRVGEQPGVRNPRYLTSWRSLPDGTFIAEREFQEYSADGPSAPDTWRATPPPPGGRPLPYDYFPFPSEESNNLVPLPYIAFNYLGQSVQPAYLGYELNTQLNQSVYVSNGSIFYARDPSTGDLTDAPPDITKVPPTASTNRVNIDWLTGRAFIDRPEIDSIQTEFEK